MLCRARIPRPCPQSLFGLPTQLRTPIYRRSYHSAEACLNIVCGPPYMLLETLHGFGLSWALAIPLSAVIVRGLIILPFIQIPARKAQQRYVSTLPITQAYNNATKQRMHTALFSKGPKQAALVSSNLMRAHRRVLEKRWKCNLWRRMLPIASLPIFLTLAETIRRMVGSRSGLLGLLLEKIWGSEEKTAATEDSAASAAASAPSNEAFLNTSNNQALVDTFTENISTSASTSIIQEATSLPWLETSLSTEGMLWFPNLMVADPTLTLPFLVSGMTFFTIWYGSTTARGVQPGAQPVEEKKSSVVLRRVLLTGALAIGPLTLKVPTAIMIYWLASTSTAFISNLWMDKMMPLKPPPRACKRSLPPTRLTPDIEKILSSERNRFAERIRKEELRA